MISELTKPQSEKRNIFNIDASLILAFGRFAILCQLISGFTEFLGVYGFLNDNLPTLPNWLHITIVWTVSMTVALFMEILTFQLVTYCTRSFFTDYFNFKDSSAMDRIKVGIPVLCLIVLVYFSMTISKRNVTFAVQANHVEDVLDLQRYDQLANKKEATINSRFAADKKDQEDSYTERKTLTNQSYDSKIEEARGQIAIIERKEQRTGLSYRTKKQSIKNDIARLEQQRADELKQLKEDFDRQLAHQKKSRDAALASTRETIAADKTKATQRNDEAVRAKEKRNAWLGYFLRELAGLSVIGFVIARFWIVVSFISTGIEEKNYIKPTFFQSGILRDFALLSITWVTRKPHNWIRKKLASFPTLLELQDNGALMAVDGTHGGTNGSVTNGQHNGQNGHAYNKNEWTTILNFETDENEAPQVQKNGTTYTANLRHEPDVFEHIPSVEILDTSESKKSGGIANKVARSDSTDFTKNADISKALIHNNRNKEKFKKKQRTRIANFYNRYKNKHDKKPSYQTMADKLGISKTTIAKYMKELKKSEKI